MTHTPDDELRIGLVIQRRGGWFAVVGPGNELSGPWATADAAQWAAMGDFIRARDAERAKEGR